MQQERTADTVREPTERQQGALHSLRDMHGALDVQHPRNISGAVFVTYYDKARKVRVRVSPEGVVRWL